jgi:DnaJ-domain-containing protein 1
MSIPERFFRIARHKLTEFRERIEQLDSEAAWREEDKRQKVDYRSDAQRELDDALATLPASTAPKTTGAPPASSGRLRSPEEIARGHQGASAYTPSSYAPGAPVQPDPLEYHYRLLGVEPGADFATVQAAYNRLAARSDPGRFPAGSQEERDALQIRQRLEESYRTLREALDLTSQRMNKLEFDQPNPTKTS